MRLIPKVFRPSKEAKRRAHESTKRHMDNEEHKQVLEMLLQQAKAALYKNDHEKVTALLHEFILHDLHLRGIINNQIMQEATISENTLHKSIELQSYYNMTRNNLLMPVIQILIDGYGEVTKQIAINTHASRAYALEYYEYITQLHSYYIRSLEYLTQNNDPQELKIYQECMMLFSEIFDTAHEEVQLHLTSAGLM